MANEYWESKLKEIDYEKLQNDDTRLQEFIRDKYERRRYSNKGKDPMTLIYEGKEPNTNKEENSDNSFHEIASDDQTDLYD